MMEPLPIDEIRRMQQVFHARRVHHISHACIRCGQPATLTDRQGNKWCETHRTRYELLNWGDAHHFPASHFLGLVEVDGEVRSARYAVGEGYALWFILCGIGDDLYVECLHHAAFTPHEEDEVTPGGGAPTGEPVPMPAPAPLLLKGNQPLQPTRNDATGQALHNALQTASPTQTDEHEKYKKVPTFTPWLTCFEETVAHAQEEE
jgi:hypothetical protein